MNRLQELLELANTKEIPHGKDRTLYDHLVGVFSILRALNANRDVTLAGLFHSIYGTTVFEKQALTEDYRPIVESVIGQSAEQLVWIFCIAERPFEVLKLNEKYYIKTIEDHVEVTKRQLNDLTLLSAINNIEQRNYRLKLDGNNRATIRNKLQQSSARRTRDGSKSD